MKFEKKLRIEIVPEWRTKYIDYKGLKKRLRYIRQEIIKKEENELEQNDHESNLNENSSQFRRFSFQSQKSQRSQRSQKSQHQRTFSMASSFFHKVSSALVSLQKQQNLHVPPPRITNLDTLIEQLDPEERLFFMALDKELVKIESFYEMKEKEAIARMNVLVQQYGILKEEEKKRASRGESRRDTKTFVKQGLDYLTSPRASTEKYLSGLQFVDYKVAKKRIKKALFEFYRSAEILRNYCILNYTGITKILKKYDKISGRNGSQLYMKKVTNCYFVKSSVAKKLLKEAEKFYGNHFEEGSRSQAMRKLRTPNKENKTYYSSVLRVGFYLGLALPVLVNSLEKAQEHPFEFWLNMLQLYASFFLPILMLLLFGINMYGWSTSRINYKFIFELDPRNNLDFRQFFELPAISFLAMSYIMLFGFLNKIYYIDPITYPIFFIVFVCIILFNPFPILYHNSRKWFILSIVRLFGSGFLRVEFRDFFIADVLTSLSYSLSMLQLFGCSHTECIASISLWTPTLSSLPAIFRLFQCLKRYKDTRQMHHFINLCKYGITIIATFMAFWYRKVSYEHGSNITIILSLWMFTQSVASLYTFGWDVKMDWSLFKLHSVNYLLRDDLGYESHWIYYYAIVSNFFLRWSWVLTVIWPRQQIVGFIIAFGEVFRRWKWNFIRVEHEHVNNCGQQRATKEIPLPFQTPVVDLISPNEFGVTITPDDHTEQSDYDQASSTSSWKIWKSKLFTKQPTNKYNLSSADSLRDFEPRNDIPEYVYDDNIYEESDEDSFDENDVDDYDIDNPKKRSRGMSISLTRAEGSHGLSNAYASRSLLPTNDHIEDDDKS